MAWKIPPQALDYEVSDLGLVRYAKTKVEICQQLGRCACGRHWVALRVGGRRSWFLVGRLVCAAWDGLPVPGQILHYIDGDSLNDNQKNLEWIP